MEKGLLYYLNGNVQMGMESTRHMTEICQDQNLRSALLDDLHAYEKFENAIAKIRDNQQIKPISPMAEKMTEMAIDMKAMIDDSPQNMAKMLARGYEKGIRDISANLEKFADSPEDELELAKGYLNFMKQSLAKYGGY